MLTTQQRKGVTAFYRVDWSDWLAKRGFVAGQIQAINWTVPAGLTLIFNDINGTNAAQAEIWVFNNNANGEYEIKCEIVMPKPNGAATKFPNDFYSFVVQATP